MPVLQYVNFLYEKKAAQIAQVNDMLENSH